jgi:hypothetical protein
MSPPQALGWEPFEWRFHPQRMSVLAAATFTPPTSELRRFGIRAGGPAAAYLIDPSGRAVVIADGWGSAGARTADGRPLAVDGVTSARAFAEGTHPTPTRHPAQPTPPVPSPPSLCSPPDRPSSPHHAPQAPAPLAPQRPAAAGGGGGA